MHCPALREQGHCRRISIIILLAFVVRVHSNKLVDGLVERVQGITGTLAFDHALSAHNLNNTSNMQTWTSRYSQLCRPFTVPSSIIFSLLQLERDGADLDSTVLGKPSHFAGAPCMTRSTSPLLVAGSWPPFRRGHRHVWAAATTRHNKQVHMMAWRAEEDPWMVLGVPRGSNMNLIRKTYRMRAKREHPDVSNALDAAEAWAKISDAYEILSDPQRLQEFYAKRAEQQLANRRPEPVSPWSKAMKEVLVRSGLLPTE